MQKILYCIGKILVGIGQSINRVGNAIEQYGWNIKDKTCSCYMCQDRVTEKLTKETTT